MTGKTLMARIKRFLFLTGMVFTLTAGAGFHPFSATAGPDESGAAFFIETRPVQSIVPGIDPAVTTWRVEVDDEDGLATKISFFADAAETEIGFVRVYSDGRVAASPEFSRQNIFNGPGIFLALGFSAPCNILPVAELTAECPSVMVKTLEKSISDQRFVTQAELQCAPVSVEACVQEGWIRDDEGLHGSLKMIRVVDAGTGQLMIRQLWNEADGWWLYEETEFHQSWRKMTGN